MEIDAQQNLMRNGRAKKVLGLCGMHFPTQPRRAVIATQYKSSDSLQSSLRRYWHHTHSSITRPPAPFIPSCHSTTCVMSNQTHVDHPVLSSAVRDPMKRPGRNAFGVKGTLRCDRCNKLHLKVLWFDLENF